MSILLYSVAYLYTFNVSSEFLKGDIFLLVQGYTSRRGGHDDDEELMTSEPAKVPLALGKQQQFATTKHFLF